MSPRVACFRATVRIWSVWLGCFALGGPWCSAQTVDAVAYTANTPGAPPVNAPQRQPIFFPPFPPALGTAAASPLDLDFRLTAPAELSAFVGETFYTPLATLYAEKSVSRKLAARLDAYLTRRQALYRELKATLESIAPRTPDERTDSLAKLRTAQKAALADLEATSEQLRLDCMDAGTTWRAMLGLARPGPEAAKTEFKLKRVHDTLVAAGCYERDLLPIQRDLLRELAMDLVESSTPSGRNLLLKKDSQVVSLLPPTSRFSLPKTLPEPIATHLAEFQKLKDELKQELATTLRKMDSNSDFWRGRVWRKLASAQGPRLEDLENRAEALRREFVRNAVTISLPPAPMLTPEIADRFNRLRNEFRAFEQELNVCIQAELAPLRTYRSGSTEPAYKIHSRSVYINYGGANFPSGLNSVWMHGLEFIAPSAGDSSESPFADRVRTASTAFREKNQARFERLRTERILLEKDLRTFLGPENTRPADEVLKLFMRLAEQAEGLTRYEDYRIAVLVPGLSPAQRHLLFSAGLRHLALPLPGGELQPYD